MAVFSIRAVCLPAGTAGLREAPKFLSGLEANEVTPAAGCKGGVTFFSTGASECKDNSFSSCGQGSDGGSLVESCWGGVGFFATGAAGFVSR